MSAAHLLVGNDSADDGRTPFPFPIERKGTERSKEQRAGVLPRKEQPVPGVDFNRVRTEITMEQVLSLLGFQPSNRSGAQWYGSCPLHEPTSRRRRRSFSVNVKIGRYFCHGCHSHGNQLELWAAATKLPLHRAAIDLCHRFGREIPWIERW
jgi:hypothetical protein